MKQYAAWASQPNHHLITLQDEAYPTLLKEIADPPSLLFVKGQLDCLCKPQLAMVGSRNASIHGLENAKHFAHKLARLGVTITSGLALGIDGASHQGALAAKGKTIAVLGSGLDVIYPSAHQSLATSICKQGALISEFPPGTTPRAYHFPKRNRIISGLSRAVLVVEATIKSGSLITAQLALEQNRDVLAMPGSIHNPIARGCHSLIKQGAKLIETIDDIVFEIFPEYPLKSVQKKKLCLNLSQKEQEILDMVDFERTTIDDLSYYSGLTAQTLYSMLLNLEVEGYISAVPGGYCRNYKD